MDDLTRWCENDASDGTRLQGLPVPSGSPTFFSGLYFFSLIHKLKLPG
jgi:hypothetical protein